MAYLNEEGAITGGTRLVAEEEKEKDKCIGTFAKWGTGYTGGTKGLDGTQEDNAPELGHLGLFMTC